MILAQDKLCETFVFLFCNAVFNIEVLLQLKKIFYYGMNQINMA
jgi:hypothetical protein